MATIAMRRMPSRKLARSLRSRARVCALQQQRHHEIVAHHERQRDAFDDHHGGRRRQAAEKASENRSDGPHRQRQHEHVGIDGADGKRQAGERDRQHEQVDRDEIKRKQPLARADSASLGSRPRDMELARQQHGAQNDSSVMVSDSCRATALVQRGPPFGDSSRGDSSAGVNIHEGTNAPTAMNATSLTINSVGHRQHQPVLMLGGVDVAGAEQEAKAAIASVTNSALSADRRHARQGEQVGRSAWSRARCTPPSAAARCRAAMPTIAISATSLRPPGSCRSAPQ